jgi:BASS family bile acid:Na+ symporter
LLTTPLILSLLITDYLPANFAMPTAQIVNDIALTLLLPLVIGMAVLRLLPSQAQAISKWSIRASLFGILLIVVGSSMAGRLDTQAFGSHNVMLVFAFVIALAIIGWLVPKFMALTKPDTVAIQMEVVVRNVNLGVLIKASMFPVIIGADNTVGDMVLFTILLYGAVQMILAAFIIFYHRKFS